MAILTDQDRIAVWKEFQGDLSNAREPLGAITKTELRAAVDAIDQWVSDNAAAMNTAIPQPARGILTAPQKARLLAAIVRRRYGAGV